MPRGQKRRASESVPDGAEISKPPHHRKSHNAGSSRAPAPDAPVSSQSQNAVQPIAQRSDALREYYKNTATTAHAQLHQSLSELPVEDILHIVMTTVLNHPSAGCYIDHMLRERVQAEEKQKRQEYELSLRSPERLEDVFQGLRGLVREVWSMESANGKMTPGSVSRQVNRAQNANDWFYEVLKYCPASSSSTLQAAAFETMVKMWMYTAAYRGKIHKVFRKQSFAWERPFLELWSRLDTWTKMQLAKKEPFVTRLINTAIVWKACHLGKEMFDRVLVELKLAANGRLVELYRSWDTMRTSDMDSRIFFRPSHVALKAKPS